MWEAKNGLARYCALCDDRLRRRGHASATGVRPRMHLRGGNLSLDTFLGDHHASEFSHDGRLVHATGTSHSNRDADGCPICKLCLLPVFGGSTAVHISVELISYREIWFSEPKIARNIGSSFLSRASPTV